MATRSVVIKYVLKRPKKKANNKCVFVIEKL